MFIIFSSFKAYMLFKLHVLIKKIECNVPKLSKYAICAHFKHFGPPDQDTLEHFPEKSMCPRVVLNFKKKNQVKILKTVVCRMEKSWVRIAGFEYSRSKYAICANFKQSGPPDQNTLEHFPKNNHRS